MTNSISAIRYQTLVELQNLAAVGFNTNSIESSDGLQVELTDTDDDVVMLIGDDINIDAKGGNNTICIKGDNTTITAEDGNNSIGVVGDVSNITTGNGDNDFYVRGDNTTITTEDGDNKFRVYGDNASVTAGYGTNQFGIIGDNMKLYSTSDSSTVAFWGDNFDITVGKGTAVRTVDFALKESRKYDDMEYDFITRLDHYNSSEKVNSTTYYDYSCCENPLIAGLSPEDQEWVRTHDLTLKQGGFPKYFITEGNDGLPVIYQYAYTYKNKTYYYPKDHYGNQKYKTQFKLNELVKTSASYDKFEDYAMVYSKNYIVDGCEMNKAVNFIENENIKNTTLKYTLSDSTVKNKDYSYLQGDKRFEQETEWTFATQSAQAFRDHDVINQEFYTTKMVVVVED